MEADWLDDIVMAEERFVKEGYERGFKDGIVRGWKDGVEMGFLKGFEYGSQIGFHQGFVKISKQMNLDVTDKTQSRIRSSLNILDEMLSHFKENTDTNMVAANLLPNIKTKHRQLSSLLKVDEDANTSKSTATF